MGSTIVDMIVDKVAEYIQRNALLDKSLPVLVGVSGGADSMALLDILQSMGYKTIVAHCNFQLRGEESIRDFEFVRSQADHYQTPFLEVVFETERYAAKEGVSIEMACRTLRYDWFAQCMNDTGAQGIVVAHHRDDSIETFFLNLLRGTGIAGLTGIKPLSGSVIRPLLCLTRSEIEAYLAAKNIDYVTDSSNKEDIYLRNRLRLQLIPLLKEIKPSVSESIYRTMNNLALTEVVYDKAIEDAIVQVASLKGDQVIVSIEELKRQPAPKALLFEIFKAHGLPSVLLDSVLASLDSISGKQFTAGGYRILKDRNELIIYPIQLESDAASCFLIERDDSVINRPMRVTFEFVDNSDNFIISKNKHVAYLDAAKLTWPLLIRKWSLGDRFVPFGMNGFKKMSDYFSDRKYSIIEKERSWLLCSDKEIVWLMGERTDNRYRISPSTKRILIVTMVQD